MSMLKQRLSELARRWGRRLVDARGLTAGTPGDAAGPVPAAAGSIANGDVTGYVRAWRVWGLSQAGAELWLKSPVAGLCWRPGMPMKGWPALPPQGIYALHQAQDAATMRQRWLGGRAALLGGEAALWGDVREHERGWRAQFAYPVSLNWLATFCNGCGRFVDVSADSDSADGFVQRIDRDEFVMLCGNCGRRARALHSPRSGDWLRDAESVLAALQQSYLPRLAQACEASHDAAGLGCHCVAPPSAASPGHAC